MYIEFEIKDRDDIWMTGTFSVEKMESIAIGSSRNTLKVSLETESVIFALEEDKKTADIVYSMFKKALFNGASSEAEGIGFVRFVTPALITTETPKKPFMQAACC